MAYHHRIGSEGLRSLLKPNYELVAILDERRSIIKAAMRLETDIIVVDISMPLPNGLYAIDQTRRQGCRAMKVVLTMHNNPL